MGVTTRDTADVLDLHVPGAESAGNSLARRQWDSREAWLEAGRHLGARIERDRWDLGDWAHHGDRAYGDLAAAAVEIGIGYGYLRNLSSVAGKVELSRRRDSLSLDHHAAVAALPAAVGDALLVRAEAEGWSRDDLRAEAQAASREGQLEAECARLRRKAAGEPDAGTARDTAQRVRRRYAASCKSICAELSTAGQVMTEIAGQVAGLHGNAAPSLARAIRDGAERVGRESAALRARATVTAAEIEGRAGQPGEIAIGGLLEAVVADLAATSDRIDDLAQAGLCGEERLRMAAALRSRFESTLADMQAALDDRVGPALGRLSAVGP